MRPVLHQHPGPARRVRPGGVVHQPRVVGPEPAEDRHVVGADRDVHRVELQQPDPGEQPREVATGGRAGRPRVGEPLCRERGAAGGGGADHVDGVPTAMSPTAMSHRHVPTASPRRCPRRRCCQPPPTFSGTGSAGRLAERAAQDPRDVAGALGSGAVGSGRSAAITMTTATSTIAPPTSCSAENRSPATTTPSSDGDHRVHVGVGRDRRDGQGRQRVGVGAERAERDEQRHVEPRPPRHRRDCRPGAAARRRSSRRRRGSPRRSAAARSRARTGSPGTASRVAAKVPVAQPAPASSTSGGPHQALPETPPEPPDGPTSTSSASPAAPTSTPSTVARRGRSPVSARSTAM